MTERGRKLEIIAGPCSVNKDNLRQIYEIADLEVINQKGEKQRAIWGTRIVGMKSRTNLADDETSMGIDFRHILENMMILSERWTTDDLRMAPSVTMTKEVIENTQLQVASELMVPDAQIPLYVQARIVPGKLLLWNPSVNQLGWQIKQMAILMKNHNWDIGLKNGKWLDQDPTLCLAPNFERQTGLERTWEGLASFAKDHDGYLVFIHRGLEIPQKGQMRGFPVHEIALRVKRRMRQQRAKTLMYFDPSHTFGPKLRDEIVERTIKVMQLTDGNDWLYDGLLIEAGNSSTDTGQHISVAELHCLASELARFRELASPR